MRRFLLALVLCLGSGTALTFAHDAVVSAAEATPLPEPARADVLPAPQIDGVVWKQVIVGNTVYAAGEFKNARPFGSPSGVNTVPRTNMLAYDLTTGALDPTFAPSFNAKINDMAVTPDHTKLVVVGTFTTVNGLTRNRVAVFDLPADGSTNGIALSTTVVPTINGETTSVAASNTTLYFGGWFSAINGVSHARVGAVSAANGSVSSFSVPVDNNWVQSLVVSPDAKQVVLAGSFTSVGGSSNPGFGLYRANAATGAKLPLPVNSVVHAGGTAAGFRRLASDSTSFYGTAWDFSGTGNTEGVFQASWSDGSLVTLDDCHGDSYDAAPIGPIVYVASHKHYCGNSGGFPQTGPTSDDWTKWHATAWTKAVAGTNTKDVYGYPDHPGTPRPGLLTFFPQFVPGIYTGQGQATWTVTGNSQYVLYGGEFLKVDGISQQGIVRFGTRAVAPNHVGPITQKGGPFTLRVRSFTPGEVRVSWPALWDRDDLTLNYHVYRDGTDVFDTSAENYQWSGGQLNFTDTGLAPGTTPSYVVHATDPDGNDVASAAASTTVTDTSQLDSYAAAVLGDGASTFWRLDGSGPTVTDLAGPDYTTAGSGVGQGSPGAMQNSSDTAATFDGTDNGSVVSSNFTVGPSTFSEEVWFNTTSTSGGRIAGFGDAPSGKTSSSAHVDRHLYMDPQGLVWFGVAPDRVRAVVHDPRPLNDGQWHQAVATVGPHGIYLYIDGVRVGGSATPTTGENYGGYWRLGADTSWSGGDFQGAIDDFSVYPTALTDAQVGAHWVASGRAAGASPTTPQVSLTSTAQGRRISLRGRATSAGNTITSYAWSFGDGSAASGENVVHLYSRPGTYTASLTVTDDRGYTTTTTRRLAVVNARPTATFVTGVRKRSATFNASRSRDSDGRIVSYAWHFGDGATARGAVARHTYRKAKSFVVRLTVTDNSGASTTVTRRIKTRKR